MTLELVHVGSRKRVVLNRPSVLIGRASDADLPLDDPECSAYECLIDETLDHALTIWSLRTDEMRTLVNGEPVTKMKLMPGDRLTVGRVEFEVHYELAPRTTLKPLYSPGAIIDGGLHLDSAGRATAGS